MRRRWVPRTRLSIWPPAWLRARMIALLAVGSLLLTAGCGQDPNGPLRLMVPTPAGGGYDFTARTMAVALREADLADNVEVFNLPGAGGGVALTRLVHESGNDRLLLQMGLGLVGSTHAADSPHQVADATPLARLLDEPEVVVVPADSPFTSFSQLVDALRADTAGLTAGIGSHSGGPDHLALMLTAEAVGLDPVEVKFERSDGGGELLAAVLSHSVDFAVTGISEYQHAVAAGELRVLVVTGPERLDGVNAPTLREAGYDLEVLNWRGLLAPPDLTERQHAELIRLLDRLHADEHWKRALRENGWGDAYMTGDDFAEFLAEEKQRVGELLDRLGVAER